MVRQVFVWEKIITETAVRGRFGLAFGDHPQIPLAGDSPTSGDDRMVVNAIAHPQAQGPSQLRIVLDELVRGNDLEEILCADGTWSAVPPGTTPDDIKDCAGPVESLTNCTAVCIGPSGPIGIQDENEDGAADDTRMRDYGGGELAVSVVCGGMSMPLSQEASFYNPSGNQLLPAVVPGDPSDPNNINGLGPAIVLVPSQGLRTGSECTITFRPEVQDKDGNTVCAPPGGDPEEGCTPGDTDLIKFRVEPMGLAVNGASPAPGETDVDPISPGEQTDAVLFLTFIARVDAATLGAITLEDSAGTAVTIEPTVSADDPTFVTVRVPGGLAENTDYTLTVGTGLTDIFGGAVPEPIVIPFTTGAGSAPMIDAGMPDAMP